MLRVVTARSKAAVLNLNKTNSHESFRSDKHVGCFSFHTKHQRHDEPITQKYQNTCEYLASKLFTPSAVCYDERYALQFE